MIVSKAPKFTGNTQHIERQYPIWDAERFRRWIKQPWNLDLLPVRMHCVIVLQSEIVEGNTTRWVDTKPEWDPFLE